MKTVIRYTGSPDSDPAQWLRINHLTEKPGPGTTHMVTIEAIKPKKETQPRKPKRYPFDLKRALAGETVVHMDGRKSTSVQHLPDETPSYKIRVKWRDGGFSYYSDSGRFHHADKLPVLFMLTPPKKARK